jgi:putative transposase
VELILARRGITVIHESIQSNVRSSVRSSWLRRPRAGHTGHLDEVLLPINGVLHDLWRAVDQHGVVLDILVQGRGTEVQPSGASSASWQASSTSHVGWSLIG